MAENKHLQVSRKTVLQQLSEMQLLKCSQATISSKMRACCSGRRGIQSGSICRESRIPFDLFFGFYACIKNANKIDPLFYIN